MKITFPDGKISEFPENSTGYDVALSISEGLTRSSAAIKVNGVIQDLTTPITMDSEISIVTFKEKEGLDVLRHSAAHVMALAVKRLYPESKLAFGPATDDGFYYDFDDIQITEDDIKKIEDEVKKIVKEKVTFNRHEVSREEALNIFKDEPYKIQRINDLGADEVITYYQSGDLIDLCRGPHLPNSGSIKAFKVIRLAGAYWKGDSNNKMLTRVYGTAFSDKKDLKEYLDMRAKAEANDHNKLGRELDLFITDKRVGKGLPLLTPRGTTLKRTLVRFIEDEEISRGYEHTATPFMATRELYQTSGHWNLYKDGMFILGDKDNEDPNEEILSLRPMTCPHQYIIYNRKPHTYKELPKLYGETSTLFRNEASGSMHGLIRVRQFTLSEGHIMCRPDQIEEEFEKVLDLISYVMKTLDLTDYTYRFSKWDPNNTDKYINNPAAWEESQAILKRILDRSGMPYTEEEGEAAFYGPKLDIQMKNVWGKEDTVITVQLDYALAERFDMKYIDKDGSEKRPVIIHRTSIGCYERTMALLIEQYGGRFPFWLAPEQIKILTINDACHPAAEALKVKLLRAGLKADVDSRSETLKKKVRTAQLMQIPVILTIGEKEIENDTVSIRTLDGNVVHDVKVDDFISRCLELDRLRSLETSFTK
ncbi:threonine--tRNA ligase [Thiospirochaeta perfilievii]|uniref:Threonine--tRNA ligase n=1 Tax=Thiospirochaeta perfilievii TaxID=252967 RepID=A0A5C1QG50_9SPIO|nr:threonine--tRNA ligase [Thiospirochaeta perfilievii]QEN05192.1 threonine--tRNA ligase [Thiospirochaeta perfilievii]